MTEAKLIARQALRIMELEDIEMDLRSRISKAKMRMYCIGGPLNDNRLGYSNAQLVTFQRILDEL